MIPARLTPWAHQAQAYEFALARGDCGSLLAMDMGTGKSAVVSWLLATPELKIRRALILCPVSVLDVWPRQIETHSTARCRVVVLDRKATVARKKEQAQREFAARWAEPLVLVTNHEAIWREPLRKWALGHPWDLVVVDESHRGTGAAGGKLTQFFERLSKLSRVRVGLTGTPMASGLISIYCQGRFIAPRVFGTSATLFRARYPIENFADLRLDESGNLRIRVPFMRVNLLTKAGFVQTDTSSLIKTLPSQKHFDGRDWVLHDVTETSIAAALSVLQVVPMVVSQELRQLCECGDYPEAQSALARIRPLALDKIRAEFAAKMATFTFRCEARDVLDLPEALHEVRHCELGREERRVYRQLCDELIAEVAAGTVTAANAMVKLLRLQMITAGCLQTDDGQTVELGHSKRDLLADLLSDLPQREPVVVFSRFRRDLDAVRAVCEAQGRRYGELSGRSRDGMTPHATMREDIDVLGAQLQAGGVGVDLVRSHYTIYYSPGYSLADYQQSLARECRPGQRASSVTYYHLVASDTVDEEVYAALDAKEEAVEAVLSRLIKARRAA